MSHQGHRTLSLLLTTALLAGISVHATSDTALMGNEPMPTAVLTAVSATSAPAEAAAQAAAKAKAEAEAKAKAEAAAKAKAEAEAKAKAEAEAKAKAAASAFPSAPGTLAARNSKAVIDYSNTKYGYVMVRYTASTSKRLKARVVGSTTYTYDITPGKWAAFPLSEGNRTYKVTVYENVEGTMYSTVLSQSISVTLENQFAPFLRSNQYVDFASAPKTIAKAAELTKGTTNTIKKIAAIYDYVVRNISYDYNKASTVKSGYLPVLDTILAKKAGICFDYAALMTGMLRSQGIPCKLVIGYAGNAYHAWISVWTKEAGWLDNYIHFDGSTWKRMDPTYASTGKRSQSIMKYINNNSNYSTKYVY